MKTVYLVYIPIIILLALTLLLTSVSLQRSLKASFFQEYFLSAQETVLKNAQLILTEETLSHPSETLAQEQLRSFNVQVQNPSVVRVTIWSKDQVVLFSDLKNIIGYHSPDHPDLKRLFSQESSFFIQKENDTNKPVQSDVGEFLDIYIPLTTNGKITGAVELQAVTSAILKSLEAGFRILGYVIGGIAVLLIIVSLVIILIVVVGPTKLLGKAKTEFIAITAHELRTPVTIISGSAERLLKIIARQHVDHNISGMVVDIHEESSRLLKIINELLDLTALEQGKVLSKKEKIDLAALIQETVKELEVKAQEKKLSLSFTLPPSLLLALADREQTKQVLMNIVSNAIQYTKNGGIIIMLERKGSFVKTVVTDTGMGIPPERQQSLFQKFQTIGERFIRSKEYGSGMGLYISKMLVESMGGVIRLEKSEIGRGSTFSFTLPIAS